MTGRSDNTEQPRILVVDDNEAVRKLSKAVLVANEFQITTAASVVEALHLIDTEPFDVLLCDYHMPGREGNGLTVISAMRHTNPNAVTLVFSAEPALKEAMDANLLQADGVLVKPMDVAAMVAVIREQLQKRRSGTPTNPVTRPSPLAGTELSKSRN